MRKKSPKSYFVLFALIFALMSLSADTSERIRTGVASFLNPGWNALTQTKLGLESFWSRIFTAETGVQPEEMQHLRLQNQLLATENHRLRELLQTDWGGFDSHARVVPAQVIFRSPSTWNSSLWINVGTDYNAIFDQPVVAKNSPVLFGRSLIGVIDYAGQHQSRVRLITDSGLTPSVRAMRLQGKQAHLLAKGELHGSSKPLWRRYPHLLKGVGFNYDFEDAEGPARDLRTGTPLDPARKLPAMPLIQVNDLLVTTGMDGVFPAGLEVALVTKVHPLKEGDYYYEIEAKPLAEPLDRLSTVFVIPPLGYDPDDQPTP